MYVASIRLDFHKEWMEYTEGNLITRVWTQGPEEMCWSLEHQNPLKTSEKMGYLDRVTVSLHILYTANQETEGSQDRLTV